MHVRKLSLALVAALSLTGCASTLPGRAAVAGGGPTAVAGKAGKAGKAGPSNFYMEPGIDRARLGFRRVAIVPNRLPLNLQDPERWRKFNFEVAADQFRRRGFTVVDYEGSARVFNESGLPIEDTRVSRDKYAELGRQLGVDLVVVPYYGTFATTGGSLLVQDFSYTGVATYQFFDVRSNQFVGRSDFSGSDGYRTKAMGFFLIGQANAMMAKAEDKADAQSLAGLLGLVGLAIDLYNGSVSPTTRWERAFRGGIPKGLEPFFAQFPGPSSPSPLAGREKE